MTPADYIMAGLLTHLLAQQHRAQGGTTWPLVYNIIALAMIVNGVWGLQT